MFDAPPWHVSCRHSGNVHFLMVRNKLGMISRKPSLEIFQAVFQLLELRKPQPRSAAHLINMSGLEVAGLILGVLGVFPVLITAVKTAVKGRVAPSASSWARKLRTEEVLFHQFVSHLLASDVSDGDIQKLLGQGPSPDLDTWEDPRLEATLLKKLGKKKAGNMMDILGEIREFLQALNDEIAEINNAIHSMGKLIIRNAKIGLSQGINERLKELHDLNVDLTRLLKTHKPSPIMTAPKRPEEKPENKLFLHRDITEAQEIYLVIRQSFGGCKCKEPHLTRFGYHCPSCDLLRGVSGASEHEHRPVWELIFQPKSPLPGQPSVSRALSFTRREDNPPSAVEDVTSEAGNSPSPQHDPQDPKPLQAKLSPGKPKSRARSISVSLQSPPTPATNLALIQDLCSVIETAPDNKKVLGIIGRKNKTTYNMCINEKGATASRYLISLKDLLSDRSQLLRRERMVLALRLSAVVLQLYLTPWIDDEWSWKNFAVPSTKKPTTP